MQAGLEDGVHDHVGVGVRSHRADLDAHALLVADGNADHRATIDRRGLELVRRFKVRVQPAIGVHAGVENQAEVVAVGKDAIDEGPAHFAELLFALRIPEEVLAVLAHRDIGVHAAAVHAHHRLGQEAGGQSHLGGDLAADELVQLDLVGCGHDFAVAVVDLELRRCDFGMILFVLEAHGALYFGYRIDEAAQGIAGQRVIVAAGVYVFELASFVVAALSVGAAEQEAFDFVGGVERVALFLMHLFGKFVEQAANVSHVRLATFIDHVAEDQDFAGAKDVSRAPVEGGPIQMQAQVALPLRGEAADRRAVKREVVKALDEEFFVVVEHVQAAFKVAEEHGHGLDPLLG